MPWRSWPGGPTTSCSSTRACRAEGPSTWRSRWKPGCGPPPSSWCATTGSAPRPRPPASRGSCSSRSPRTKWRPPSWRSPGSPVPAPDRHRSKAGVPLSEAIQPTLPRGAHGATILVVEDDPRIVELLHIALGAHGFRVVSALNGDDGWRMLVDDPPDLAIFDVRLPRRSGLDLVESVRREPSLLHLPVILVSALAETESRLAGLARGADDYLAKPFSPKELVARVRRMLARAEDTKSLVRRNHELLAEVERSRGDLKRLNHDLRREFWVKDAFLALSQELSTARRVEEVAAALLGSLASNLGVSTGAVLVAGPEGGPLTSVESRGWSDDRLHRLVLSGDGELARLVAGLARPVRRAELERFRELETERRPLVAAGVALLVPLVTRGRLVGAVVLPEKRAGGEF